jgi:hypothetical protein
MNKVTISILIASFLIGCKQSPKTPQEQIIGKWQLEKTTLYRTSLGKELTLKSNDKVDTTVFDFPIITSLNVNKQGDFFAFENSNTLIKSQWKVEPKKLALKTYNGEEQNFVLDTLTEKIMVLSIEFYQIQNLKEEFELDKLFSKGKKAPITAINPKLQSIIDAKKKKLEMQPSGSFEQLLKKGKVVKQTSQLPSEAGREIRKYFFVKTNS